MLTGQPSMKNIFVCLVIVVLGALPTGAQAFSTQASGADDPILQALIDKYNRQQADNPREKIFLQTHKPFYLLCMFASAGIYRSS